MERVWKDLTKTSPSHISIVGPRYSGKSVLMRAVSDRSLGPDSPFPLVLFWDLGHQTPTSDDEFMGQLIRYIREALRNKDPQAWGEHIGFLEEPSYESLREVIGSLRSDGVGILCLWDGFDRALANGRLTRHLWDQLRELASFDNLRLVTASRKTLRELIRSEECATSDFWNIFDMNPVRLGVFDDEDCAAILAGQSGLTFEGGAQAELMNWTAGFPPLFLAFLNRILEAGGSRKIGREEVNSLGPRVTRDMEPVLNSMWDECPALSQDLFRALAEQKELPHAGVGREEAETLVQKGFARLEGIKLKPTCRMVETLLQTSKQDVGSLERLFGTPEAFQANIRSLLERRLRHLDLGETRLTRLVARSIEDIPEHPDDCLNNLTAIEEAALDYIWSREFGSSRSIPQELINEWTRVASQDRTVISVVDSGSPCVPPRSDQTAQPSPDPDGLPPRVFSQGAVRHEGHVCPGQCHPLFPEPEPACRWTADRRWGGGGRPAELPGTAGVPGRSRPGTRDPDPISRFLIPILGIS